MGLAATFYLLQRHHGVGGLMRLLCIDPAWEPGTPSDALLQEQGYGGVRFVARPDLFDQVAHYINLGLHVMLVLARESGDPAQYAEWGPFDFGDGPRLHWVVGNEPDGSGDSSWSMTPRQYRGLWRSARVLQGERWVAGMCSGDPARAAAYLQRDATGLCVHLYTLGPDGASARLADYGALGLPVWVGEWHQADDFALGDYDFGEVWANDFCFSSAMVPGMGLYA
jgi:hypothetical protein